MTTQQQVETLRGMLAEIPESSRDFATSLCTQFARRGTLTERQEFWVNRLIAQQQRRALPTTPTTPVGDLSGVMELFARARAHLQRPAIVLQVAPDYAVRLTVAGETARFPGSINVTSADRGYGRRGWYGRVVNGSWQPGSNCPNADAIGARLVALAANPATVAAEYGHLHGNCCFCMRPLSDDRSTTVGYGPICAGHYGLPWGERGTAQPVSGATDSTEDYNNLARREARNSAHGTARIHRRIRRRRRYALEMYTYGRRSVQPQTEDSREDGFGEDQ